MRRIIVILVAFGLAGGCFAFWVFFSRPAKPDIDKLGGTILIYEIAPLDHEGPDSDAAGDLAKKLQFRLDPANQGVAVVRPAGKNRVEILLPRTGQDHAESVKSVKDLVAMTGNLEFRVLANDVDDKQAIDETIAFINSASNNPKLNAELEEDQNNGQPPPSPRKPGTKEPKIFTIKLPGGGSRVSYDWVELGRQERHQLGLSNVSPQDQGPSQAWTELNSHRKMALQIPIAAEASAKKLYVLQGALFYSRKCQDRNLPEDERRNKKFDYFVFARNPEIDTSTGKETPKIDGSYLVSAYRWTGTDGRPAVSLTFNTTGGRLLSELTRKNVPSGEEGNQVKRHLAIILDGLIMTAPTINSEMNRYCQISGDFTDREVDQLVNIFRAGAFPATLKPLLVSEVEVKPKQNR